MFIDMHSAKRLSRLSLWRQMSNDSIKKTHKKKPTQKISFRITGWENIKQYTEFLNTLHVPYRYTKINKHACSHKYIETCTCIAHTHTVTRPVQLWQTQNLWFPRMALLSEVTSVNFFFQTETSRCIDSIFLNAAQIWNSKSKLTVARYDEGLDPYWKISKDHWYSTFLQDKWPSGHSSHSSVILFPSERCNSNLSIFMNGKLHFSLNFSWKFNSSYFWIWSTTSHWGGSFLLILLELLGITQTGTCSPDLIRWLELI